MQDSAVLRELKNYISLQPAPAASNKRAAPKSSRQFVEQQEGYLALKEARLDALKAKRQRQLSRELTYRPRINKTSRTSNEVVFDRLTKSKKRKPSHPKQKFQPTILEKSQRIVRQGDIGQLLYQDALRRNNKSQSKSRYSEAPHRPCPNKESSVYAQKRILRLFFEAVQACQVSQYLTMGKMLQILEYMGYISSMITEETAALAQRLYDLLSYEKLPATQSLMNFIFVLQNHAVDDSVYEDELGRFQEGVWLCQEKSSVALRRIFRPFIFHRMHSGVKAQGQAQQESFAPQILEKSKVLALRSQQRVREAGIAMGLIGQETVLMPEDRMQLQAKIKQIQQQQKKENEKQISEQCTVDSKIKPRKQPDWKFLSQPVPKPKPQQPDLEQYSFRPKINPAPLTRPKKTPTEHELMHLKRAEEARKQRAKKPELRHYPGEKEKSRWRIVVAVRINQFQERDLVLQEDDSLETVAQAFAQENGLSWERQIKLVRLLQERISL